MIWGLCGALADQRRHIQPLSSWGSSNYLSQSGWVLDLSKPSKVKGEVDTFPAALQSWQEFIAWSLDECPTPQRGPCGWGSQKQKESLQTRAGAGLLLGSPPCSVRRLQLPRLAVLLAFPSQPVWAFPLLPSGRGES